LQGQVDLVVNATSVGMLPQIDASPWPEQVPIPAGAIFYDIVYYPIQTLFLRRAQEAGQKTVNGVGMVVHQGAVAFEIWTGQQAPVETMRQVCLKALGSDY
jgi:shikimate dehydrogenase